MVIESGKYPWPFALLTLSFCTYNLSWSLITLAYLRKPLIPGYSTMLILA